jgi:hypothetical protein
MRNLLFLLALTLALSGCSRLSTAVVPPEDPSVRHEAPDTSHVDELPPVEMGGEDTEPLDVTVYDDTSSRPTTDVEAVEIDRSDPDDQTVTVRSRRDSQTVETTFEWPSIGERTVLYPDSSGLQGTVFGAPTSYETQVRTSSIERPWWREVGRQIRLGIAVVGGLVFGVIAGRLLP